MNDSNCNAESQVWVVGCWYKIKFKPEAGVHIIPFSIPLWD